MSEPKTVMGKAQLAEMWPDDAPMDSLRVAYAQTLAAIEAEAAALERERLRGLDLATFLHGLWGPDAPWHNAARWPCAPAYHRVDAERIIAFLLDEPTP